jgi:basic amino acid/polyamine antiporter, APA family
MTDKKGAGPALVRSLGLFDATMLVMGGIVGAGIFMNPAVVARKVGSEGLILLVWLLGGILALAGAFVYAELGAARPSTGGQYAYYREAFHPMVAFVYGWALLLVTQTGGMAAVAVTFARYFREVTGVTGSDGLLATATLAALTVINGLGVTFGARFQSALMVVKIAAIAALVGCGLFAAGASPERAPAAPPLTFGLLTAVGAALVPVVFAYGGWQTSSFVAGEMRDPRRDLPRSLLLGMAGVVVLYLLVSFVCVRVLGPAALAATTTPASEVMRRALGSKGGRLIAVGIAVSTLGFLSQGILTAPRVYFAMARDGVFFERVGRLTARTRVPLTAIALQGAVASVIAVSGTYEQILNYDISVDFIFFGLTGVALFVLRGRRSPGQGEPRFRMPGHPATTIAYIAACWLLVANTVYRYPKDTAVGLGLLAAGVPVYFLWRRRA